MREGEGGYKTQRTQKMSLSANARETLSMGNMSDVIAASAMPRRHFCSRLPLDRGFVMTIEVVLLKVDITFRRADSCSELRSFTLGCRMIFVEM